MFRTYKPLSYFGLLSFILALLATGFLIPVLITYMQTGLVPQFPTLIVCGFTYIAAIQSFFAGLQLQTIVHQNRQDFELNLQNVRTLKELIKASEN